MVSVLLEYINLCNIFNQTLPTRQMLAALWGESARDIAACLLYVHI